MKKALKNISHDSYDDRFICIILLFLMLTTNVVFAQGHVLQSRSRIESTVVRSKPLVKNLVTISKRNQPISNKVALREKSTRNIGKYRKGLIASRTARNQNATGNNTVITNKNQNTSNVVQSRLAFNEPRQAKKKVPIPSNKRFQNKAIAYCYVSKFAKP